LCLVCFVFQLSRAGARRSQCAVVRMACGALGHVRWTSVSLARPLRQRLISTCNPLNTAVKEENVTVFSGIKYLVSLFLCSRTSGLRSAHRRLIAAAAADQQVVPERRSKKEAVMHATWRLSRTGSRTPPHRNHLVSPSPPPRARCPPERHVVIERVIKEASTSVQYPTLTRTK
jgi:hypothetical protein